MVGTCPRPCVAAKPRPRGEAALRAKARGLPRPATCRGPRGEATALRARGETARGEAASCRGKAARGKAAYNLVFFIRFIYMPLVFLLPRSW